MVWFIDIDTQLALQGDNASLEKQLKEKKEENEKLKELLKEWMHFYPIILYEHEDTLKTKDIVELYDKTREVLK